MIMDLRSAIIMSRKEDTHRRDAENAEKRGFFIFR